jgi:CheY-like chemotaxis protein
MARSSWVTPILALLLAISFLVWGGYAWQELYNNHQSHSNKERTDLIESFVDLTRSVQGMVSRGDLAKAKEFITRWAQGHRNYHRVSATMSNGFVLLDISQPIHHPSHEQGVAASSNSYNIWYHGEKLMILTLWQHMKKDKRTESEEISLSFAWRTLLLILCLVVIITLWWNFKPQVDGPALVATDNDLPDFDEMSIVELEQAREQLEIQRYFFNQIVQKGSPNSLSRLLELVQKLDWNDGISKDRPGVGELLTDSRRWIDHLGEVKRLAHQVTGRQPTRILEEFDLNKVFEQLFEEFHQEAWRKRTSLVLEVDGHYRRMVSGDPSYLKHLLSLLLKNAVAFTFDGSIRLVITTSKQAGRRIKFTIQDTGVGIDMALVKQRFSSFLTVDQEQQERISPEIYFTNLLLKQRDEQLKIVSQEGVGNTFTFSLPIKTSFWQGEMEEMQTVEQEQSDKIQQLEDRIEESESKELKLLVVDDSPENCEMVEVFLKKLPIVFTFAANGQEAVDQCRDTKYDLILMDMQMPILSGSEAASIIRQMESEREEEATPIIALSAHIVPEDVSNILKSGCDHYISKPVNQAHLIEMVKNYGNLKPE